MTLLHDHGSSAGAFMVVEGSLLEDHGRAGSGRLLQRRIPRGRARSFGPGYVHNLANAGPGLATSIHAYTPRLTTMTYYAVLPGGAVPIRSLAVRVPRAGGAAVTADELYEQAASRIRRLSPDEAVAAVRRGALLVDLRPTDYRWRGGRGLGRHPRAPARARVAARPSTATSASPSCRGPSDEVVLMCSEGYASSALGRPAAARPGADERRRPAGWLRGVEGGRAALDQPRPPPAAGPVGRRAGATPRAGRPSASGAVAVASARRIRARPPIWAVGRASAGLAGAVGRAGATPRQRRRERPPASGAGAADETGRRLGPRGRRPMGWTTGRDGSAVRDGGTGRRRSLTG